MKKFEFSLDRLLEFKEKSLDHEKEVLAGLRNALQQLVEERRELEQRWRDANEQFNRRAQQGVTQQQMQADKTYIRALQDKVTEKCKEIAAAERKTQKQLDKVVALSKEISSIEKLREKQLEDYRKEEQKENEIFIEEFVTNSSYYTNWLSDRQRSEIEIPNRK